MRQWSGEFFGQSRWAARRPRSKSSPPHFAHFTYTTTQDITSSQMSMVCVCLYLSKSLSDWLIEWFMTLFCYTDSGDSELEDFMPVQSLTRREGKRPGIFLRFRPPDPDRGTIKVFAGKLKWVSSLSHFHATFNYVMPWPTKKRTNWIIITNPLEPLFLMGERFHLSAWVQLHIPNERR